MEHDVNNLKIEVAVINQKLDTQAEKLDEISSMLKQHIIDEEGRYKEIMDKKADKWVQQFVTGLIVTVCLAVIGALMTLVLK